MEPHKTYIPDANNQEFIALEFFGVILCAIA